MNDGPLRAESRVVFPASLDYDTLGVPVSATYGDVYHSAGGGREQAWHVFLQGNELPGRWQGRGAFCIVETGFGLGLNFLSTWDAWQRDPARSERLEFISFEKHPFVADDLARAHLAWPELGELSRELCGRWPELTRGEHRIELAHGRVTLRLFLGDAVEALPHLEASVDAVYLDGFSPARNPELWSLDVCGELARVARDGATLATWSVAGSVRRALQAAGFALERRPGFAGKRQMLVGRRRSREASEATGL